MQFLLRSLLIAASLVSPLALASAQSAAPSNLDRALASVREDALRADLHFIASDEMGGRDTPSQGLEIAKMFLRSRLQRLGYTPGGRDGGWFFDYPIFQRKLDSEASSIQIESARGRAQFTVGTDYFFESGRQMFPVDQSGELVSVGTGTTAEIREADVAGKWALVQDRGRSSAAPRRRVASEGAIGIVFVPGAEYAKKPYIERYARGMGAMLRGFVGTSKKETKLDLPVIKLSAAAAERLYAMSPGFDAASGPPAVGVNLGAVLTERRVLAAPEVSVSNVCGFWPGSDPELKKEVLIVSAHYDHVGRKGDVIYNGADDNGSGTTGLLAVAEALQAYGPLRRSVLLIWVSGEEKGLWGSAAWTKDPVLPEGCIPVANINIDMIGRTEPDELYLTPTSSHHAYNAVARLADELAPLEGFPTLLSQDRDWARSDHANFSKNLEIPVTFLSAGEHEDYHQPTDTPDKIEYAKMRRIVRLVVRMLDGMQGDVLGEPYKEVEVEAAAPTKVRDEEARIAAIPDYESVGDMTEVEWAHLRWLVNSALGGDETARAEVIAAEKQAYPALLNELKSVDLTTAAGLAMGDRCQKLIMEICNGMTWGWKDGTSDKEVVFNRKVVLKHCEIWETLKDNDVDWKKFTKRE